MINKALIMAAGKGERLQPITDFHPKPLVKITKDSVLIDYIINALDVPNIYLTVGYKKDQLINYVSKYDIGGIIDTEGKDNSWWIFNSILKHMNEPIIVATSDIIVDIDFDKVIEEYECHCRPACMLVSVPSDNSGSGDYIIGRHNIVEKISRDAMSFNYASGIQILNPTIVNALAKGANTFKEVWDLLIDKKQLYYSTIKPTSWFSVDTIQNLTYAREAVK